MILTLIGLIFLFFVPGFLIVKILFEDIKILEVVILSLMLSIGFYVFLGVFLGFSELNMKLTGGLSKTWTYTLVINLALFVVLIYRLKKPKKKSSKRRKKK